MGREVSVDGNELHVLGIGDHKRQVVCPETYRPWWR